MNLTSSGISTTTPLVGSLVALIIALVGAVIVAALFLGQKNKGRYKGLMQKISAHMNFDRFLLSSILKFLYAFAVLYCVVYGLISMFSGTFVTGLLLLLLGPVGLRVAFEQLLLLLSLREEASETNDLLRRMQGLPPKNPPQPVAQPQQPAQAGRAPMQANRAPVQANRAPVQADPRYAQRPAAYPANPSQSASYSGYNNPSRQAPMRPNDYGSMTQRYAPVRSNTGYGANGYDAGTADAYTASTPVVRPTPADGTGRFSPLPKREEPDSRS